MQSTIEYSSDSIFIEIIENRAIKVYPTTSFDVKAAEDIFGTNVDTIQGKTRRTNPNMVKPYYLDAPHSIMRK